MDLQKALALINSSVDARIMYLALWAYIVEYNQLPDSADEINDAPDLENSSDYMDWLREVDAHLYRQSYDGQALGYLTLDGDSPKVIRSYRHTFESIRPQRDGTFHPSVCGNKNLFVDTQIPITKQLVEKMLELLGKTVVPNPTQSKEVNPMSTIANRAKNALSTAGTVNKDAAFLAAELAVGKAGLTLANKALKPKVPMLARGYVGTVYGDAVVANLVLVGVQAFAPNNAKANAVANAMVRNAAVMLMQEIDIEGLINSMFDGIEGGKVDELTAAFAAANGRAGLDENSDKIIVD